MPLSQERLWWLVRELESLLQRLISGPRDTTPVASFLRVHAANLNIIVTTSDSSDMLYWAAEAGHPDVMLTLLSAGARPSEYDDLYNNLLAGEMFYDLNGDVLDDAGTARRLRVMHESHGLRVPSFAHASRATHACVRYDRLECLRAMVEIDPRARGYHTHRDTCESLLHLAASYCKPRIVRFLLENGWSLAGHNLNLQGWSPLGVCLRGCFTTPTLLPDVEFATLDALLHAVDDAAPVVRSSGVCEADLSIEDLPLAEDEWDIIPPQFHARMLVYICTAVGTYSSLPQRALTSPHNAAIVLRNSPSVLRVLPLDEHVRSIYLHDSLRVASSFDSAARYAAAVDALCTVETTVAAASDNARCRSTCMDVLRGSGAASGTGTSSTLRCWAWMRRLHAVSWRARLLRLQRYHYRLRSTGGNGCAKSTRRGRYSR